MPIMINADQEFPAAIREIFLPVLRKIVGADAVRSELYDNKGCRHLGETYYTCTFRLYERNLCGGENFVATVTAARNLGRDGVIDNSSLSFSPRQARRFLFGSYDAPGFSMSVYQHTGDNAERFERHLMDLRSQNAQQTARGKLALA